MQSLTANTFAMSIENVIQPLALGGLASQRTKIESEYVINSVSRLVSKSVSKEVSEK